MRESIKNITLLYLTTRIILLLFIWFFYDLIPINTGSIKGNFVSTVASTKIGNALIPWDGQWFLEIAERGYPTHPTTLLELSQYGVFPLYPAAIKLGAFIAGSYITSGIFINGIASLIGCLYLYKVARLDFDPDTSQKAAWFFLINPTSIFFVAVYSEALFFCLSIMAIYYARTSRWLLTGIFGCLATLTRSVGVLLLIPLGIQLVHQLIQTRAKPISKLILPVVALSLIILGYVTFALYTQHDSGVANTYLAGQRYFGRSAPSLHNLANLATSALKDFRHYPTHGIFVSKLDSIWITIFLMMTIFGFRHLPLGYGLYNLGLMVLPLSAGTTTGIVRYLAVAFPIYLSLAISTKNRPLATQAVSFALLWLLALFSILYTHWYWVG